MIGGRQYGLSNVSVTTSDGRPAIVNDFYSDNAGTVGFASAGSDGGYNYAATNPGDKSLFFNGSATNFAQEVEDIVGGTGVSANWEGASQGLGTGNGGYQWKNNGTWYGYTQGPNYWGKTFFVWPPDPNPTKDWRRLYFGNNTTTKTVTNYNGVSKTVTLV